MNSIKSNFNYTTNPGLIVITVIAIIVLFFILTRFIEKYKSSYTVYEKTDTINKKIIKMFHTNNFHNLNKIDKAIDTIQEHKNTIHFTELITIQDNSINIIESTLTYQYLRDKNQQTFSSLLNQFTLNFHNIPVDNIQMITTELKDLQDDVENKKGFIINHSLFTEFNYSLEGFLEEFKVFMKYCKKNSKNAVIIKMESLKPLSAYELDSFEKTFSHFGHKNDRIDHNIFELYQMVDQLFKEENIKVLQSIKNTIEQQVKIDELQKKSAVLENKIELLIDLLIKLRIELLSLDENTRRTSSLRSITPMLFNTK